jgi:peptidoglycan/LPS O-acetylase OafA/YrhL
MKEVQWTVYIITAVLLLFKVHVPLINDEFYSVLFCFNIINLATNPATVININYKWLNYLGKISYGIYLYNTIMRLVAINIILRVMHLQIAGWGMQLLFYGLSIGLTIGMSIISYELYEKYFLKMKSRFAAG